MSAAASIEAAARGQLPDWAVMTSERRAHAGRVAALMDDWAAALGEPEEERARWHAAAWLHDALRDAAPVELRPWLRGAHAELPDPLLHGPAAAARLRGEGVHDAALLMALTYHSTGHPELDRLGRALFLADFLEPGRVFEPAWRASQRARMPGALEAVLVRVVAAKITHLIARRRAVDPASLAFWNALVG